MANTLKSTGAVGNVTFFNDDLPQIPALSGTNEDADLVVSLNILSQLWVVPPAPG